MLWSFFTLPITGSHQSEEAINKQLGDKERVAAALENPQLLNMVNMCIAGTDYWAYDSNVNQLKPVEWIGEVQIAQLSTENSYWILMKAWKEFEWLIYTIQLAKSWKLQVWFIDQFRKGTFVITKVRISISDIGFRALKYFALQYKDVHYFRILLHLLWLFGNNLQLKLYFTFLLRFCQIYAHIIITIFKINRFKGFEQLHHQNLSNLLSSATMNCCITYSLTLII